MSSTHHIGNRPDFLNRVPPPRNPLLSTSPLSNACGYTDALYNCASVLATVADLFGGNADGGGYEVLASDRARRGVWFMLYGVIDVLEAAAKIEPNREGWATVTATFDRAETDRLKALAEARGLSVESLAESLIKDGLNKEVRS